MVVSHFRHPLGDIRGEVLAYALALSGGSGGKINRLLYNVVTSGHNQDNVFIKIRRGTVRDRF